MSTYSLPYGIQLGEVARESRKKRGSGPPPRA